MAQPVDILLLDDGELDDVQQMLEELGRSFGRVRGGAIAHDTPPPTSLLVSTPRRISAIREHYPHAGGRRAVRIMVVNEDSPTLRKQLRETGFDYLVRRPVHPEALRLLLLRCLYTGEERRKQPRVSVGCEVSFRSGLLPRRSTLVELSVTGCRLLSRYALEPGKRLKLEAPQALGAGESVSLRGRILRTTFDERLGSGGLYTTAIVFEKLSDETVGQLEQIMREQAQGLPALSQAPATAPGEPVADDAPQPLETDVAASWASDPRTEPDRPSPPFTSSPPSEEPIHRVAPDPPPAQPEPASPVVEEAPPCAAPPTLQHLDIEVDVRMGWGEEESEPKSEQAAEHSADRRSHQRSSYDRKIPAFGDRALRVLVGRDLSVGGMRVEPLSELEMGDRLHLAIYGAVGEEPSLVWATVTRDDGGDGMALRFDPLEPGVGDRLESLVAKLPAVESLHDEEAKAMGTVVSEILDT